MHFVKALSTLTDQCKNPGAGYTGVQETFKQAPLSISKSALTESLCAP